MTHHHALPFIPVVLAVLACLASAETSPSPSPSPSPGTGLEGVITLSPTHGGPIRQGEPESKPMAKGEFVVRDGDRIVASFVTDEEGRFHVALPPGKYSVGAKEPRHKFGGYGPFPAEITAGKMTQVHWDCDTGLR